MRSATLIIALIVGNISLLQACTVAGLSSLGTDENLTGGAALGVLVGFFILIGGAFVLGLPRVAMVFFVLAGLAGILIGVTTEFSGQLVWGIAALILAGMAFLGYRGKRKDDVARAEERANLAAVAAGRNEPAAAPAEPSKTCPNCAETVKEAARTCRHCGYSFEKQPTA